MLPASRCPRCICHLTHHLTPTLSQSRCQFASALSCTPETHRASATAAGIFHTISLMQIEIRLNIGKVTFNIFESAQKPSRSRVLHKCNVINGGLVDDYLLQHIIVIIYNSAVVLVCWLHVLLTLTMFIVGCMLHFSCTLC